MLDVFWDEINIHTVEDPVEVEHPWLTQTEILDNTQMDKEERFTFQEALEAILRQNPQIIWVWEIRNEETAKMCAQASLTGHWVFATIHAADCTSIYQRLKEYWISWDILDKNLKMTLNQQMTSKLCPYCKLKSSFEELKKYNPWLVK